MSKDQGYELGNIYRDPGLSGSRADFFRSSQIRKDPSRAELDLKVFREPEDGYDHYGVFDPKMRTPSLVKMRQGIVYNIERR